ncbi:hypothetical protein BGX26_002906, partial [Mortierella sp. AD094]
LPTFPSAQLNTPGLSYTSPLSLDIKSESSGSVGTGRASKPATPGHELEDRRQSHASSMEEDDPQNFTNNVTLNHYLQSSSGSNYSFIQSLADNSESYNIQAQSFQSNQARSQSLSLPSRSNSSALPGSASSDTGDGGEDPAVKKAEQNRAAQRAFRQRKQQYIKWLEGKAEELNEAYRIMSLVRTENEQLRKLVMELEVTLNKDDQGAGSSIYSSISKSIPSILSSASIGSDVMDLMNLATFPGLGLTGERKFGTVGRPKYNPRSSTDGKKARIKGSHECKPNFHCFQNYFGIF